MTSASTVSATPKTLFDEAWRCRRIMYKTSMQAYKDAHEALSKLPAYIVEKADNCFDDHIATRFEDGFLNRARAAQFRSQRRGK